MEGEWKNNFLNGKGIKKWPDGNVYEGDFVNSNYLKINNFF